VKTSAVTVCLAGLLAVLAVPASAKSTVSHYRDSVSSSHIKKIPLTATPNSFASGSDGALWFGAEVNDQRGTGYVGRFDVQTNALTIYDINYGIHRDAVSEILNGPDGNLWFIADGTQSLPSIIGKITTAGHSTLYVSAYVSGGLAIGPDGAIWSRTDGTGTSFARVTTQGGYSAVPVPVPPGYSSASASTPQAGPNGDLWYCQSLTNPQIGGVGAATVSGKFVINIPLAAQGCQTVEYGPDGNIWTSDPANGELLRITPRGHLTDFRAAAAASKVRADSVDYSIWYAGYSGSQTTINEFSIATKTLTTYAIAGVPDGDAIRALWIDHSHQSVWFSEDGKTPVKAIFRLGLH
jgi:streptogramin lyase